MPDAKLALHERVAIPLLEKLIPGGVRPGTMLLVEFDPASQWLTIATNIAARFLMDGGRVTYMACNRPLEDVRFGLEALGVDAKREFKEAKLVIDDWYSAGLSGGRLSSSDSEHGWVEPIEGGGRMRSLKVADLSVQWLKDTKQGFQPWDVAETWPPGALGMFESLSEPLRFNDENAFAEWMIGRAIPNERRAKRITFHGIATGIHSEPFYRRMENASDGIIEMKVLERDNEAVDCLRVKSLKGQPRDARWHEIEIKPNGEAILSS